MKSDTAERLRAQADAFRKLREILVSPTENTTPALMHAEICRGLAEVCDGLAEVVEGDLK